jgi:Superinfection immunity protein
VRLCSTIAVAAVVFSMTQARADQLDEWCKTAKLPSSIIICGDPELLALAIERQHAFEAAQTGLSPDQQKELLADQNGWVKSYAAACGVPQGGPPPNPVPDSVKACFMHAGQARIAYLRGYGAGISRGASAGQAALPGAPAVNPSRTAPGTPMPPDTVGASSRAASAAGSESAGAGAAAVILLLLAAFYFLPAIIAAVRHHRNAGAVFFLNLFLGWTLVGWVIAFVWAVSNPPTVVVEQPSAPPPKSAPAEPQERYPCPLCAELIVREARVCRYCGHELAAGWLRLAQRAPSRG